MDSLLFRSARTSAAIARQARLRREHSVLVRRAVAAVENAGLPIDDVDGFVGHLCRTAGLGRHDVVIVSIAYVKVSIGVVPKRVWYSAEAMSLLHDVSRSAARRGRRFCVLAEDALDAGADHLRSTLSSLIDRPATAFSHPTP